METRVSVVIPTYKRAELLKHVLEGLKKQTFRNFEAIIVVKSSGDETQNLLKEYSEHLQITVVTQKSGFVPDAYNLGLKAVKGEIIVFLDDDAVPYPNWLEEHLRIYSEHDKVGGVSGSTKPAICKGKKISETHGSFHSRFLRRYHDLPWARPLNGMQDCLIYFGQDGLVHHRLQLENSNLQTVSPSLLHMGANMSIKKQAIECLYVNDNLILGFAFEQLLAYQIWKRGYKLLYNPNAKVSHVIHKESTGRFYANPKRAALRDAEFVLTFFLLKPQEKHFSYIAYLLSIISLIAGRTLRAREYGIRIAVYRTYGILRGVTVGIAYMLSGQRFPIRTSLSNLL